MDPAPRRYPCARVIELRDCIYHVVLSYSLMSMSTSSAQRRRTFRQNYMCTLYPEQTLAKRVDASSGIWNAHLLTDLTFRSVSCSISDVSRFLRRPMFVHSRQTRLPRTITNGMEVFPLRLLHYHGTERTKPWAILGAVAAM